MLNAREWKLVGASAALTVVVMAGVVGNAPSLTENRPEMLAAGPSTRNLNSLNTTRGPRFQTLEEASILKNQKVIVFAFYGRHVNLGILDSYLYRNLRRNGGVVDILIYAIHEVTPEDKSALMSLMAKRPQCSKGESNGCYALIDARPPDGNKWSFWLSWKKVLDAYGNKPEFKDAIWLKVDDDIVFIRDGAIEAMVLEKRTRAHECGVLSANVVNHPVLAHVHQRIGVYTASYAPPNWQRNKGDPHRYFYEYDPWGQCSLKSYDCAKNTHLTFLHNAHQDTDLQMYRGFHIWDFHTDNAYNRFSINCVMLTTKEFDDWLEFAHRNGSPACTQAHFDDEMCLSSQWPKATQRHACAVSDAVVVHFTYMSQSRPRMISEGVLQKYSELSELMKKR